ncbi:hypothetical protein CKAH01_11372 [Colletotrichum kahawae]|uniref:Uncharacterized protein n=1 Tax=Colletotrichum kahawae TaxID=34407 RepID=A0AAD9YWA1_COLKA|nr:hypothetical protein CKAH01_11372 [Colletotrichum kahawae]
MPPSSVTKPNSHTLRSRMPSSSQAIPGMTHPIPAASPETSHAAITPGPHHQPHHRSATAAPRTPPHIGPGIRS